MTEDELPQDHPLRDSRVHALMGLVTGSIIAGVGVLLFEGLMMWLLIGVGVLDAITTPYILGKAIEGETADGPEQAVEGW